tara:strand:- start:34 stop:858 length:825 start_codon:yes stop_codon:yes gene_type:complete
MKIKNIEVKSIITKSNLPDTDYVINPYIGCQHKCEYCYADFMKRFTGHKEKWGEFIDIKQNAPDLIKCNGKYTGKKILFSSVTDPYQPIESKYQITRNILKQLLDENPTIEILTKAGLVVRDIDIIKQFSNATVGVSLSTLDKKLSGDLECFASHPNARLNALKKCKENGINTYVFISPILPYITDIEEIINTSKDYADYFIFENLNLTKNKLNKILPFIRRNRPELEEKYKDIYTSKFDPHNYWVRLKEEIINTCKKHQKTSKIFFHHGGFKK